MKMDTLASFPFVIVRIRCKYCKRAGEYRLARLAAKYGSAIEMGQLLDQLALDCEWRKPGRAYGAKDEMTCGAYYPDLTEPPRPPDIPPMMMKLKVVGEK